MQRCLIKTDTLRKLFGLNSEEIELFIDIMNSGNLEGVWRSVTGCETIAPRSTANKIPFLVWNQYLESLIRIYRGFPTYK